MNETGVTLDDWQAWHRACALDLVSAEVRGNLCKWIGMRFSGLVRRLGQGGLAHRTPADADCAHLLETWCCLHRRQEGKRYKDWLMSRGDRSLGAVESGVSLLLRKVVTEWVRMEFTRVPTLSLEAGLGSATGGLTLEELLPGKQKSDLSQEERDWALARSDALVAEMSRVEQAALAARRDSRSFVDPEVLRAAGVSKSGLHNHFRAWIRARADEVKAHFPELPPSEATALVLSLMEICAGKIFLSFSVETQTPPGCRVMEESHEH